jgi:hypothetical protein
VAHLLSSIQDYVSARIPGDAETQNSSEPGFRLALAIASMAGMTLNKFF